MRAAVVVLVLLTLALAVVCYVRGGTALLLDGLRTGLRGMGPLLPMLLVISPLVGFTEVLLPRATIATWLSDSSGWRGLGLAFLLGLVTPGGGPIGLPIAAALLRAGAGVGVVVTFLSSLALLSFVRIPLELGIYGLRLTVIRILSCLPLPFLAGLVAQQIIQFTSRLPR